MAINAKNGIKYNFKIYRAEYIEIVKIDFLYDFAKKLIDLESKIKEINKVKEHEVYKY